MHRSSGELFQNTAGTPIFQLKELDIQAFGRNSAAFFHNFGSCFNECRLCFLRAASKQPHIDIGTGIAGVTDFDKAIGLDADHAIFTGFAGDQRNGSGELLAQFGASLSAQGLIYRYMNKSHLIMPL